MLGQIVFQPLGKRRALTRSSPTTKRVIESSRQITEKSYH
jgi:hypothetical protein